MAIKLSNVVSGYLLMGILTSLFVTVYLDFEEGYNLTRTGDIDGKNIAEKLNDLDLISAMQQLTEGIYGLVNPANIIDIIGGFLSAGIGLFRTIGAVIVSPIDILGIITQFYDIPAVITTGIGVLFSIYVGFAILNKYTGGND